MSVYEWDLDKDRLNRQRHGVGFTEADHFEWETALTDLDDREDYGEDRYLSLGFLGERLHMMVWTPRGKRVRVISLRKATRSEERAYAEAHA